MKYDEDIVVAGLRKGDQRAYKTMVQRFKPSMFVLINNIVYNKQDAKDLLTHTFEDAFLNIHRFMPYHKFSTWLFSIAKNNCIDFLRTKHMVAGDPEVSDLCEHVKCSGFTPEELFIRNQQAAMIRRVVSRLKPKSRNFVTDYYFAQLKYSEISEKYQIPEATVRTHIHRAKNKMRELLTNKLRA